MKRRVAHPLKTRGDNFSPVTDFVRIKLHEQTGDDIEVVGRKDGIDFTATYTLAGTPADTIWTNFPAWFEADGSNAISLNANTDVISVLTPANYSGGAQLILSPLMLNSSRTDLGEQNYIYSFGSSGTVYGVLDFYIQNSATAVLRVDYRDANGSSTKLQGVTVATEDVLVPFWTFLDFDDLSNCLIGLTGVYGDATAFDASGSGGDGLPVYNVDRGAALGAKIEAAASMGDQVNAAESVVAFHDLWVISFDTVPTAAEVTAIVKEFAANPYEKLLSIP